MSKLEGTEIRLKDTTKFTKHQQKPYFTDDQHSQLHVN